MVQADMSPNGIKRVHGIVGIAGWHNVALKEVGRNGDPKLGIVAWIEEKTRIVEIVRIETGYAEERCRQRCSTIVNILFNEPYIWIVWIRLQCRNVTNKRRRQHITNDKLEAVRDRVCRTVLPKLRAADHINSIAGANWKCVILFT